IKSMHDGCKSSGGPKHVQLDVTGECDNSCLACWCNSPLIKSGSRDFREHSLDYNVLTKAIDELSRMRTREITISGGGEPFKYKKLIETIQYIKNKNITCILYTNFIAANKDSILKLVEAKLDCLVVSVWAGSQQTYNLLHPGIDERSFGKIKENILFLSTQNPRPLVRIHNVISSLNYHEVNLMLDFAQEIGADEVSFSVVDIIPGMTDSLLLTAQQRDKLINDLKELRPSKVKVVNLNDFIRRLTSEGYLRGVYDKEYAQQNVCYTGWLFSRIDAKGNVNPCLKSHKICVGNIYEKSFSEIWNSSLQLEFRRNSRHINKNKDYFSVVGNSLDNEIGCSRFCDDALTNMAMHRKLSFYPSVKVLRAIVILQKKLAAVFSKARFFGKIIYLFFIVFLYSLFCKVRKLFRKSVIFPGE
ncbi:radical SAM protein, partial [bacterium]